MGFAVGGLEADNTVHRKERERNLEKEINTQSDITAATRFNFFPVSIYGNSIHLCETQIYLLFV